MDMKRYVLVQVKVDLPKTVKAGEIYEKYTDVEDVEEAEETAEEASEENEAK